ncbi:MULTISPECIES: flagellar motor control protein ZomB [Corynebacterium]|uniref:flagellar motor control protein ZomB n=1 Tax=Corynebacterium TaxID=1716 RepID=UPI00178C3988|nr:MULTISPECIES: flagellar motor control protein ZomB [Corynebacterium]
MSRHRRRHTRRTPLALSTAASALLVAVFAFVGGWMRRWMSDDGLIVLRTVRNLQAGHGPVFNIGERVEANTSTLWQYLIYVGGVLTHARLEMVALALALLFTTGAGVIGVLASARFYRGATVILLPVGMLVYFALPPARDFATSGLEWGLSIFYLAVLWWVLLRWGFDDIAAPLVGFVAGMSWLVRPELALYGGVVIIVLVVGAQSWRSRGVVLAAALPVPLAYEIFRMGYYGVLVPQTAVAKSASGAEWASGLNYLRDFSHPYVLPVALAVISLMAGTAALGSTAQRRPVLVTGVFEACALVHVLYVLRVGGDFMHGRMLLLPLFALLLPAAVLPLRLERSPIALALAVQAVLIAGWSGTVAYRGHPWEIPEKDSDLNIVDERGFYYETTGRDPQTEPLLVAENFLTFPSMQGFPEALQLAENGEAAVLGLAINPETDERHWAVYPRTTGQGDFDRFAPTINYINLGMTSMNSPLDVRVLEPVGLATPLAARSPRLESERIGHDKLLSLPWVLAESSTDINRLPPGVDREAVEAARHALVTPEFQELAASYREPMSMHRFLANIRYALSGKGIFTVEVDPQTYSDVASSGKPITWN